MKATPETLTECANCGKAWPESALREIPLRSIPERVAAGEVMPYGECPTCGALCHNPSGLLESAPVLYQESKALLDTLFATGLASLPGDAAFEVRRACDDLMLTLRRISPDAGRKEDAS